MDIDLRGKVIVISGGTKGVGKGVAVDCAKAGAKVVIAGRDDISANELLDMISKDYQADGIFIRTDLYSIDSCENLIRKAVEHFGRIDGFVNYAGILPAASLTDTPEKMYDDVFTINVKAAFYCAKYAIQEMLKTGGGALVFVGSAHAYGGEEDRAAYSCSKGALLTLVRHIAKNYAKHNIRANWITMGWVATPGEMALRHKQGHDIKWLEKKAAECIPMKRLLTVEDHTPGIIYLLSDESSMVTGTEMHITGGFIP